MNKVTGNTNFAAVANTVEVATAAIAMYIERKGMKQYQGVHVNRQLVADTVTQRLASNVRLNFIAANVK